MFALITNLVEAIIAGLPQAWTSLTGQLTIDQTCPWAVDQTLSGTVDGTVDGTMTVDLGDEPLRHNVVECSGPAQTRCENGECICKKQD